MIRVRELKSSTWNIKHQTYSGRMPLCELVVSDPSSTHRNHLHLLRLVQAYRGNVRRSCPGEHGSERVSVHPELIVRVLVLELSQVLVHPAVPQQHEGIVHHFEYPPVVVKVRLQTAEWKDSKESGKVSLAI